MCKRLILGTLPLLFLAPSSFPIPEVEPLIDSPLKTIGSDFNGDGRNDFIIGSDLTDTGGNAYVFFGSTTLSGTKNFSTGDSPDFTVVGKAANDGVGRSVASAGDVNGDGIDDILLGADRNDDRATDAGAAYLFFGLTTLGGTTKDLSASQFADFSVIGKAAGDGLGISVSGAGDVNGDGFDDFIVGAYLNDDLTSDAGTAYVFYGSQALSGTKDLGGSGFSDVSVLGKASTDRLGRAVSGGGDLNRDGFDDLWIGAPNNDDGTSVGYQQGAAYVFFGGSNLSSTIQLNQQSADMTVLGKGGSDYLGKFLSGSGDVNRDGFDDWIVGSYRYDTSANNNRGAVYVFFGSTSLSGTHDMFASGTPDVSVIGVGNYGYLGNSVSNAGDINDDGFDDMIMGAYRSDNNSAEDGAIYVLYGSSTLSGTRNLAGDSPPELTIIGKASGDQLGKSVSGLGDVNGDGIPDMIAGAWRNDDGGSNAGAAYLFFGSSNRITGTKRAAADSADMTVVGKSALDELGAAVGGGRNNPGP
jgi:hypothetical protein